MKLRYFYLLAWFCLASVIVLQTGFAQGTSGGQGEDKTPPAEAKSERPGHEGIKVHGHWVIDVRNPDGTLATHREFENALQGGTLGGGVFLGAILSRTQTVGRWMIRFAGNPGPCSLDTGHGIGCLITEIAYADPSGYFPTLVVSFSGKNGFVLSGSAIAQRNSTIDGVTTTADTCSNTSAPSQLCGAVNSYVLTSATLSPAVNVVSGQSITVTVTITFS